MGKLMFNVNRVRRPAATVMQEHTLDILARHPAGISRAGIMKLLGYRSKPYVDEGALHPLVASGKVVAHRGPPTRPGGHGGSGPLIYKLASAAPRVVGQNAPVRRSNRRSAVVEQQIQVADPGATALAATVAYYESTLTDLLSRIPAGNEVHAYLDVVLENGKNMH